MLGQDAHPLLLVAVVLLSGVTLGALAKRLRLPSITGQIVAGALLGPAGFAIVEHGAIEGFAPLTEFALGLMAVTVGAHLDVRRLHNAGLRLGLLLLLESILVPTFILVGTRFFSGIDWTVGLLLGMVGISTAPATIVALVKETRSKGVFVKTLVAAVALNNMACIFLFEVARLLAHDYSGAADLTVLDIVFGASFQLLEAGAAGALAAFVMFLVHRFDTHPEHLATLSLLAIVLTWGIASVVGFSPMLSCLFFGLAQANIFRDRDKVVDSVFRHFEPAILAIFFTLAGMQLHLDHAAEAGTLAATFFATRGLGKIAAGNLAMRFAGTTRSVRQSIGPALIPQAGVAVGLVILLESDQVLGRVAPAGLALFPGIVLTAVVANELVGPVLTRMSLARSGEVGRDRERLIDFLHEEHIVTNLSAGSMEEAIEKLVAHLVRSHHIDPKLREPFLRSVLAREAEASTALGGGLCVPHGILPEGMPMVGVMAISGEGFPFGAADGNRLHCIVLLGAPPSAADRHLQVLAHLVSHIGHDPAMQMLLYQSKSPAHAYEVLHNEEAEDFNYFLDSRA